MVEIQPFSPVAFARSQAQFGSAVRCAFVDEGAPPLFVEPLEPALRDDLGAFVEWFHAHRDGMEAALINHGAVVFRGFPVRDTDDFKAMIDRMPTHSMGYAGGSALRKAIKGQVMEATQISGSHYIHLHQEMSYLPNNPRILSFFCRLPAETGGATVIADMRRVTAGLPSALLDKLAHKGVRYTRNLLSPHATDGRTDPKFGQSNWIANFGTDDRQAVEIACGERGLRTLWREDGSLDLTSERPALTQHPVTGETLYFNQAHVQIARRQSWLEGFDHMMEVYGDKPKGFDACFGDGTEFCEEELDQIHAVLRAATVAFPWRAGDVMFVENKFTAHGRERYTGRRDTQVALFD